MLQKTTNLTTILAILGLPTTLFGRSSGRGTRQSTPEGRLGGCHMLRDLHDLCKIQTTYICSYFLSINIPYDSAHIWARKWGARRRSNLTSPTGLRNKQNKQYVLAILEKPLFHMTARIFGPPIGAPGGRPNRTSPLGLSKKQRKQNALHFLKKKEFHMAARILAA